MGVAVVFFNPFPDSTELTRESWGERRDSEFEQNKKLPDTHSAYRGVFIIKVPLWGI